LVLLKEQQNAVSHEVTDGIINHVGMVRVTEFQKNSTTEIADGLLASLAKSRRDR